MPAQRTYGRVDAARTRLERGYDLIEGGGEASIHDPLHDSRLHLDVCGDADAAPCRGHSDNQPGQTEEAERRLGRGDVDTLRTIENGLGSELQPEGPEAHDLIDVAKIGLTVLNPRRNPPRQKIGITFDIGREIEGLLAGERKGRAGSIDHGYHGQGNSAEVAEAAKRSPRLQWQGVDDLMRIIRIA